MPLQSQIYRVDLTGGVQQHADAKHLPVGALTRLENGRAAKLAAIEKRPGNTDIGTVAGVTKLLAHGNELLAIDGASIWSYSPSKAAWIKKDLVSEATCRTAAFPTTATGIADFDLAVAGNYVCVIWRDGDNTSGSAYFSVLDLASGTELRSTVQLAAGKDKVFPRVRAVGTTSFILCWGDTSHNIKAASYTPSTDTLSAVSTLRTDSANTSLQIAEYSDGSGFVLVYDATGASPTGRVYKYNNAFAQQATVSFTTAGAGGTNSPFDALAIAGEHVWVAMTDQINGTTVIATFDPTTLASTLSPTVITGSANTASNLGLVRISSSRVGLAYLQTTSVYAFVPYDLHAVVVDSTGALVGTATGTNRVTYGCRLASRPFLYGSKYYAWCITGISGMNAPSLSATLVDLNLDDTTTTGAFPARPVARGPRRSCKDYVASFGPAGTGVYGSTVIGAVINERGANLDPSRNRTGLAQLTADFADTTRWTPAQLSRTLHLSGGVPTYWDGRQLAEIGFEWGPALLDLTPATSGGNLGSGSYNYVAVYGFVDETGAVHRSQPSAIAAATTSTATSKVTLHLPSLGLTLRQDAGNGFAPSVFVEIYRTAVNSAGPYYLVSSEASCPLNDVTLYFVTYIDTASDASIASNRQLYTDLVGTTEAKLENVCPPSSSGLVTHNGCLWSIGDDGTIWYTKARVDGDALAFVDEFTLQWDEPLLPTALHSLDQNLVIFSKQRPYVVTGTTPADNGGGSSLAGPYRISSDYGCNESRSLVALPDGLVFLAPGGLAMLTRDEQVVPTFGWAVQSTLATYPTVTSAVVHPTGQYVLIACTAGGNTGARLYYDYTSQQWGVDYMGGTVRASAAVVAMVVVNGAVYWADADGHVYSEDATGTVYTDAGAWVTLTIETGEIKLTGLQGYQRVWKVGFMGAYYSAHDLSIGVATDYGASTNQTQAFTNTTLVAWNNAGLPEQCQVHLVRQLCESVRVVVSDAMPTGASVGTGRGASFQGLDLELGMMPRLHRLQASQRG